MSFGDELIRQDEYIDNCKPTLIAVVKQIKNISVGSTFSTRAAVLALKAKAAELREQLASLAMPAVRPALLLKA